MSPGPRYSTAAKTLHGLLAAALLFQIVMGWRMTEADDGLHAGLLRAHRSVGITILLLSLARLGLRLATPARPERLAVKIVHTTFYVLMIGLPLTGWALASSTHGRSTWKLFGAIPWPDLPFLSRHSPAIQDRISVSLETTHSALVWVLLGLFTLHVLAALKHHFLDRDEVLSRMVPNVLLIPVVLSGAVALAFLPGAPAAAPARPIVSDLGSADVYLDVVGPMLTRRCLACHNEEQSRGGLSVATHADLMAGGNTGPSIVPHSPQTSELLRRLALAPDHEGFMPRGGRPALKPEQTEVLHWWVSVGAPGSGLVSRLPQSDGVRASLQRSLGLASAGVESREAGTTPWPAGLKAPDPAVISRLESQGFVVRAVAAGAPLVDVAFNAPNGISDEALQLIAQIGPQIRGLSLRAAGLRDEHLKSFSSFENLRTLRLDGNGITDAGIGQLADLRSLTTLNVVQTRLSDGSLSHLGRMKALRSVYAWGTSITAAGAAKAQRETPGLEIQMGNLALSEP